MQAHAMDMVHAKQMELVLVLQGTQVQIVTHVTPTTSVLVMEAASVCLLLVPYPLCCLFSFSFFFFFFFLFPYKVKTYFSSAPPITQNALMQAHAMDMEHAKQMDLVLAAPGTQAQIVIHVTPTISMPVMEPVSVCLLFFPSLPDSPSPLLSNYFFVYCPLVPYFSSFGYTECTNAGTCDGHGTCQTDGTCSCSAGYTGGACDTCDAYYYSAGSGTCQCMQLKESE